MPHQARNPVPTVAAQRAHFQQGKSTGVCGKLYPDRCSHHATFQGNLGVVTSRLLRNILPMNASWVSLKPGSEFLDEAKTRIELAKFFGNESQDTEMAGAESAEAANLGIPEAITSMLDKPLAIEALGGMMFYLRSLNMANDLLSQRSFNVYDPIRKGENLVLDGQTLSHLEVSRDLSDHRKPSLNLR